MNKKDTMLKSLNEWLKGNVFGGDSDYTDPTEISINAAIDFLNKNYDKLIKQSDFYVYPNGDGGVIFENNSNPYWNYNISFDGKIKYDDYYESEFKNINYLK